MKFAAYKFAGGNWLVGFVVAWGVCLVGAYALIVSNRLPHPLYEAAVTIKVGDPHPMRHQEMPWVFSFDIKSLTAETFLQGLASRLTGSERNALMGAESNEMADDVRVMVALKKARSLSVNKGRLTLTCRHTDQQLPERLVTLHLEEWDDYLKHLSREKLGPEIRDLQRMLEEANARLQDIQRRSVGGGLVEIEKLEQARVVGLSARIAALANGSPYDKVGAIIRARDPMMNYPRKVTLLDYCLIGGGALIAGGGVLLVGLLCLVAVCQLIGRGTRRQRGVVSGGGRV